jgi:hypothetical protein
MHNLQKGDGMTCGAFHPLELSVETYQALSVERDVSFFCQGCLVA